MNVFYNSIGNVLKNKTNFGGLNMAQIKLSPEELESSATKYASGSDEIQNVLNATSNRRKIHGGACFRQCGTTDT